MLPSFSLSLSFCFVVAVDVVAVVFGFFVLSFFTALAVVDVGLVLPLVLACLDLAFVRAFLITSASFLWFSSSEDCWKKLSLKASD